MHGAIQPRSSGLGAATALGNARPCSARLGGRAARRVGARQVTTQASTKSNEETRRLAEENAHLRQEAAKVLEGLTPEQRSAFEEEHTRLRADAVAAGLEIPAVGAGEAAQPAAAAVAEPAEASHATAEAAEDPAAKQHQSGSAWQSVAQKLGVAAQVEESPAGDFVFRFDAADSSSASEPVGNGGRNSAMAVPEAGGGAGGKKKPEALVFNFDSAAKAASEEPKPVAAASGTPAKSAGGNVAAAAPAAFTATATSAKQAPAPPPVDTRAAEKAAAAKEALEHTPAVAVKGRENWLYFSVPEKPVAGAPCVLYFNKAQSEALRNSNRLQLHAKYNSWELVSQEGDRVDLNHEGRINRAEGVDFYRAQITVPENAYELNFVFSNGDGVFDNNANQNYVLPVQGPMTRDLWVDTAPERAEAAWRAKKEQEAREAAEAAAAAAAAAEAEDRRKAEEAVAELKREYSNWRAGAVKEVPGRWRMLPAAAQPGSTVTIQYNRPAGPISGFDIPADQGLNLTIGHNGWKAPQEIKLKRAAATAAAKPGEEWWEGQVKVPLDAAVLNFVVAYYEHYDNNDRQDFKALIDLPAGVTSVEAWADSLHPKLLEGITATRKAAEAVAAELERVRRAAREAAQDKAEAVRRKQMRHVLFTTPEVVEAGQEVTVFYNPNNSALPGRERIWIKGGWNRWRHPKGFGPLEMTPPEVGDHFQATIKVPKDAYSMDFVFTDAQEFGQYDSNGGLDYHLPVEGSVVEEPPLHVVHIAVEMAPICKVGGLGDVVTALGRAVQEEGHTVEVILPRYDFFQQSPLLGGTQFETEFDFGGTKVFVSTCVVEGLRCFFIEPRNGMFSGAVYQGNGDGARFDFFSRAALEFLLRTGRQPDILHCHDWSSADVAKTYWNEYHHYGLWKPKVVFTIHNMDFGQQKLGEAAYFSQKFTTVSPSYAWEIGGHPAIAPNAGKLMGVRNGIDVDIWDPETDIFLPKGYTADTVVEGKAAARAELRKRLNMTGWGDKPLVGVVSRLTKQKGTHLIAHACFRTIDRGGQFVLLGSAPDPKVQAEFNALQQQYGGENAAFAFAFDEPLSHLIYAACDVILVPSMFEPCGLTQMIAMRYGAVPVVRQTGGLKDTVFDVDNDKPRAAWEMEGSTDWQADGVDATNGFSFEGTDAGALDYALNRALDAYYNDRAWFHGLQKRVMQQDWSWNKPAHTYIELYYASME